MLFNRLENAKLAGQTALVRVDFNVPRHSDGTITDDTRLKAALPTIQYLRKNGAKTVLLAHFGRPKGEINPDLSLGFIVSPLSKALGCEVSFSDRINKADIEQLEANGVLLLENSRFHPGETQGDSNLASQYATLGDLFVADAFSVAHRNHVTSAGIANYLPAYAGLAMEREIDHISQVLDVPRRPVMGIVGGAKVSTKIELLQNLVKKLDILAIGGGMANTFLYAQGHSVGKSLYEADFKDTALKILDTAEKSGCQIVLPIDVVAAKAFEAYASRRIVTPDQVGDHEMILDAGPETVDRLAQSIDQSQTLIWNGPLGAFEIAPFDTSTIEAARYAAKKAKSGQLIAVAGGGDTVSALNHVGVAQDFTFVSTAGGAFLEWMEGKPLPGIEILKP